MNAVGSTDFPDEWPSRLKKDVISYRAYQWNIYKTARKASTMVVLPTGLGKSVIFLLLIADIMERKSKEMILLMAPTKPLVQQHFAFLKKSIDLPPETNLVLATGEVGPEKRKKMWKDADVVVSTPQVIKNDIEEGSLDLTRVSLIIFDECHRATGEYAYVHVAEAYKKAKHEKDRLVLGLTASPGHDEEQIEEICRILGIQRLEIRDENDEDVKPYVQERYVEWVPVGPLPAMRIVTAKLRRILNRYVNTLRRMGFLRSHRTITGKAILSVQGEIQARMKQKGARKGMLMQAMSIQASAVKVNHLLTLCETQELYTVMEYVKKLEEEASEGKRPAKRIIKEKEYHEAREILESVEEGKKEHPKSREVVKIVVNELTKNPEGKVMVFAHYRNTASTIVNKLAHFEEVNAVRFVGQANRGPSDSGLKQKEQKHILDSFRQGYINCLVATSVGEEGLDIPETDLVVFFEPVPSEIRLIQRRGRTARHRPGKVVILYTKGTRDISYNWTSSSRERKMRKVLEKIRRKIEEGNDHLKPEAFTENEKISHIHFSKESKNHETSYQKSQKKEFTLVTEKTKENTSKQTSLWDFGI